MISPAGRKAELFNDQAFSELRAYAKVPDDFINSGWSLESLKAGGGKGGTLMASVGESYIVKELSKGDHECLLRIASSYSKHVREGATLLCPIFIHFRDQESNRCFFAMKNTIGSGPFKACCDLKGCADDKFLVRDGKTIEAVHKRIWNVGMWCGQSRWSEARKIYHAGKVEARSIQIAMKKEDRDLFLVTLRRDTEWLASQKLMDYSLLVAIKEAPAEAASGQKSPSSWGLGPFLQTDAGRNISIFASIIDFFQVWTMGKRVARVIKSLEFNKATIPPGPYAARFAEHFASHTYAMESKEATPSTPSTGLQSIAPPAGDMDLEDLPEERLTTPPMPTNYTSAFRPHRA
mmetsp:Transcript_81249/g.143300  ORF Transcript_81249/g.143300 Transcript_81249/m.143300 type:complete len:349 (-) Transcript_81249:178-1224(-)